MKLFSLESTHTLKLVFRQFLDTMNGIYAARLATSHFTKDFLHNCLTSLIPFGPAAHDHTTSQMAEVAL
jgi:hypothetical protein